MFGSVNLALSIINLAIMLVAVGVFMAGANWPAVCAAVVAIFALVQVIWLRLWKAPPPTDKES